MLIPVKLPSVAEIAKLAKSTMTIEERAKIMELREAALLLQEENLSLRATNKELTAKLKTKKELAFKEQFYWKKGDPDPLCARCLEKDQHVIYFSPEKSKGYDKIRVCPECSREYKAGSIPHNATTVSITRRKSNWVHGY